MPDNVDPSSVASEIIIVQAGKDIVSEEVAGETIIINLLNGHYHRLEGTASRLWGAAKEPTDFRAWLIGAGVEADALMESDLAAFALALFEAGLIRLAEAAEPALRRLAATAPSDPPPLVLESYSDMEDLLLLDPIHDVDDHGWPRAAEPKP